jgi:hypothetical protein
MEGIDIEEMDCDTCLKMQKILSDEINDTEFLEFAIENLSEMMGYIVQGNLNIRIHRDITGECGLVWGCFAIQKIIHRTRQTACRPPVPDRTLSITHKYF